MTSPRAPFWGWLLILIGPVLALHWYLLLAEPEVHFWETIQWHARGEREAAESRGETEIAWQWLNLVIKAENAQALVEGAPRASWEPWLQTAGKLYLASMMVGIIALGRRLARRSAADVLRRDGRQPVLYLRSFVDDNPVSSPLEFDASGEKRLVRRLRRIGPVIALGRPGERLPRLGAARLYLPTRDWENVVESLAIDARLVVLRVGTTPGLLSELGIVRRAVDPRRVVLFVPAGTWGGEEKDVAERALGVTLPALSSRYFIGFDEQWSPRPVGPLDRAGTPWPFDRPMLVRVPRESRALVRTTLGRGKAKDRSGNPEAARRFRAAVVQEEMRLQRHPPYRLHWAVVVPFSLLLATAPGALALNPVDRQMEIVTAIFFPLAASLAAWVLWPRRRFLPTIAASLVLLAEAAVLAARSPQPRTLTELEAEVARRFPGPPQ